jgi:hypothetical protein
MKKNTRSAGVFHGFIGVMAFIAYALPFMFVTTLPLYRIPALPPPTSELLERDWIARLWFRPAEHRGIAYGSHHLVGTGRVYAAALPF